MECNTFCVLVVYTIRLVDKNIGNYFKILDNKDNKMNIEDKKTEIITIRCTKSEKGKIERKSEQKHQCVSVYMLDCSMAGLERRRVKDRDRLILMVERQEQLNALMKRTRASITEREALSILMELVNGESALWES